MFTLTNDFHNNEVRVRKSEISPANARRISRKLCPFRECICGDWPLGTRGLQEVRIEAHQDGGATLYPKKVFSLTITPELLAEELAALPRDR